MKFVPLKAVKKSCKNGRPTTVNSAVYCYSTVKLN